MWRRFGGARYDAMGGNFQDGTQESVFPCLKEIHRWLFLEEESLNTHTEREPSSDITNEESMLSDDNKVPMATTNKGRSNGSSLREGGQLLVSFLV